MRRLGGPCLAVGAIALASCAQWTPPRVGEPVPTAAESSLESAYQAVFNRYSSHAQVYGGFDTRFFAGVTYESVPFREARLGRQATFQQRPREWLRVELEKEMKVANEFHEVLLGVHLNDTRYEDFDKPNTMWNIALVTSAGEVAPVEIRRIGRADLNLAAYYPYLDLFWNAYRIRFPRVLPQGGELVPPGTQQIVFRMASSLGKADMAFPAQ